MKNHHPARALALAGSLLASLFPLASHSRAAAGDVDLSFDPSSGVNGAVAAVVVQPDGKVIITGDFTMVKGIARNHIARLNPDGSGDATFDPESVELVSPVRSLALQSDGKVLVGHPYGILRLNSNGTLDTNFNAYLYTDYSYYDPTVSAIVVQPDGKILVGGYLATIGTNVNFGIARLNLDGSLDTSFNAGSFSEYYQDTLVDSIALQPDGKVLVGGLFATRPGTNISYSIARLNATGELDTSFYSGTDWNSSVTAVVRQPDGKVLLGGDFLPAINGTNRARIARLQPNGSLDGAFNPGTGADAVVSDVLLLADGRVVMGGAFTNFNGTSRIGLARLNGDGSLDTSFNPGAGIVSPYGSPISSLAVQADGKLLVGGSFNLIAGTNRNRIARLNSNGSLDSSFYPGRGLDYSAYSLVLQPDGKVLVNGLRLNPDGSLDNSYVYVPNSNTNFNPNLTVPGTDFSATEAYVVQPDGKVLIGGYTFTAIIDSDGGYYPVYAYFLFRFNPDGSRDLTFEPALGDASYYDVQTVRKLAVQPDGKILVGGTFYSIKGTNRFGIARLNVNGSLDSSFIPGFGGSIYLMLLHPDGRILVGGNYGLASLNSAGSRDPCFNPTMDSSSPLALVVEPDGRMLIGGSFSTVNGVSRNGIARLNTNGSLDSSFDPGLGADGIVRAIALQPDGNVLLGGDFLTINGVLRPFIARLLGGSSGPRLRLFPSNNDFKVAWPSSSAGFRLQESTSLNSPNWMNVLTLPATVGLENQIAISPSGQRYFRLASNLPPAPPPAGPLVTAVAGDGQVSLSWTASLGATGHHVQRATNYSGPYTTLAHPNSTNYTDTSVVNGTTYYYIVAVTYPCGQSAPSNPVGATPLVAPSVHVQSIAMGWVSHGSRFYARAVVRVVDNTGTPVGGATVTGNFSGSITNNGQAGSTAGNGEATITAATSIRNGTVTFTVTGISAGGFSYNPAANLVSAASISR